METNGGGTAYTYPSSTLLEALYELSLDLERRHAARSHHPPMIREEDLLCKRPIAVNVPVRVTCASTHPCEPVESADVHEVAVHAVSDPADVVRATITFARALFRALANQALPDEVMKAHHK